MTAKPQARFRHFGVIQSAASAIVTKIARIPPLNPFGGA